jgi:thiol-disulfide isomerase/thioredoxin
MRDYGVVFDGLKSVAVVVAMLVLGAGARAQGGPLAAGSQAPSFSLTGTDGKVHTLGEWKASKVLVVAFLCNHCTESQVYEARVNGLVERYADKGVSVVAIQSSNPKAFAESDLAWSDVGESLADMKERASYRKFAFPYLYDGDGGATATAFGATVAPTVFVLDGDRKVRYSGRIDDDAAEGAKTKHYAADAIDALLANEAIAVTTTAAEGCALRLGKDAAVKNADAALDAGVVTVSLAPAPVLKELRQNPTGKLLLVNFYATWCGPCVTEFPDLMETNRMYRGRPFSFTTVSSNVPDEQPQVLKFLQKMHATTKNLLYGSDDTYAMQDAFDPEIGAAVPVTVLLGPKGEVLFHEVGEIDLMEIRRAILANLPDDREHAGSRAYWAAK